MSDPHWQWLRSIPAPPVTQSVGRFLAQQKVGKVNLRLVQKYNFNNVEGQEIEILDVQRHSNYASGFRCLAKLVGFQEPIWLTIDWFCTQEERPTKRTPDRAKSAVKKPSSTKPRKSTRRGR